MIHVYHRLECVQPLLAGHSLGTTFCYLSLKEETTTVNSPLKTDTIGPASTVRLREISGLERV